MWRLAFWLMPALTTYNAGWKPAIRTSLIHIAAEPHVWLTAFWTIYCKQTHD